MPARPNLPSPRSAALTPDQRDRAAGVLLGQACGDALGAGYEFGPPLAADVEVVMRGGGSFDWAPGEWTDDTAMSVPLLEAAELASAVGDGLADHLDHVAARWSSWARTASDVGAQTRTVLLDAEGSGPITAAALREAAARLHERTGRTGGNGSLMRTSPIVLAYLPDPAGLVVAARTVSGLTHPDPDAGDACVLWCLAIRHAVLHGELDLRGGLSWLDDARRSGWLERIEEAEARPAVEFANNGWVVHAFQAAWSAIVHTPVPEGPEVVAEGHLRLALENAVRVGNDTDTVAAIAGQLLGARWGARAVPQAWRDLVFGWPGITGENLVTRALALV